MKLLIVLITTAADKCLREPLRKLKALRRLDWYHRLVGLIEQKLGSVEVFKGPVGVVAMLALPLLVFWLLLSVIGGWHGILWFLLTVAILFYCLGPDDLDDQVGALIAAIRANNDAEANHLAQTLGRSAQPVSTETREHTVVESILTEFQERVFGVLLWFLILGPLGAVLFRFSAELRRYAMQASSGLRDWAGRVYNVLAWLPSRIVALGYALSGNFSGAFESWRVLDTLTLEQNETALRQSGTGALQVVGSDAGEVERITAAQGLVTRTLIVLLAILTVLYVTDRLDHIALAAFRSAARVSKDPAAAERQPAGRRGIPCGEGPPPAIPPQRRRWGVTAHQN